MDTQIKKPSYGLYCLPQEIILDIASRLPITSLVQFKCVCKSFHNLLHDKELVNLHLSRAINSDPCIIFHTDYRFRSQQYFFDFADKGRVEEGLRTINNPFANTLLEFDVVGSCQGLLCVCDSLFGDTLCVYNPFTRDYIELPKSVVLEGQSSVFGFGFHPVTKEYKVIKIIDYDNPNKRYCSDVQVLTVGTNIWRSIEEVGYRIDPTSQGTMLDGKLHWVTQFGNSIVFFDLADEVFGEVPKADFVINPKRCKFQLTILGGCLAVVLTSPQSRGGGLQIWVMREYNVRESWVKQFTIGANSDMARYLKGFVKVLCMLKNGELLLEYKYRALILYDPKKGVCRALKFKGMPHSFQAYVHVGGLKWIDTHLQN